ncbi:MAG: tRNA 2-thiouridine(34) synthase MnmA [Bacteroidia bacterium]|nr:tRNA 2-thiouridine(34) synthase MnmA [Bacteroidia bacterium]MDW8159794.1 tRNA 2-thiouridine(34) synthase MnmA [Bacteroidia bacterium]
MLRKERVLVAMSGGVDSSVAAALLHQQGYEVIGITMKTWDYANSGGDTKETGCCSLDSINDARAVAVKLGFPHFIIDIRQEFGDYVIDNFVEEYLAGRTPNPCVLCNTHIKWEALLRRADKMECHWIATGHYAQLRNENGRIVLFRGRDSWKDQSYVLWGLSQTYLQRTLLPIGNYQKQEIRAMAAQMGFENLAKKSESYEICFIPDNDYRSFLRRKKPELAAALSQGEFRLKNGKKVGYHQGYPFYTIGQRKGLPAMGEPYYVIAIEPATNTVIIGKEEELFEQRMIVRKVNLIKYEKVPENGLACTVKIRYKDAGTAAWVYPYKKDEVLVIFEQPVRAITPGQSAVFYEDGDVIGGGWIAVVGESTKKN